MRTFQANSTRRCIAVVLIVLHLFTIGCAARPENIPASFIGADAYNGMSCAELRSEIMGVNGDLAVLSAKQDSTATLDTTTFWVGMLLLWPATFVPLFTDDNATEIAELKGRQTALDNAIARKCLGG